MLTLLLSVALAGEPVPAEPAAPAESAAPAPAEPTAAEPAAPAPAEPTAAEPDDPSGPLTDAAFTARVAELVSVHGTTDVAVATPGFDAVDRVRATLSAANLGAVAVTRVSELAEPEKVTTRLVRRSACVLYVVPAAGRFRVTRFGACAEGRAAPPADPPSLADRDGRRPDGPQRPPAGAEATPPSIVRGSQSSDLDLRLMVRSDWDLALARLNAPDPVAATVMSGLVGFGSGHFYAKSPGSGTAHLIVQLASSALMIAGTLMQQSFDDVVFERGQLAMAVGTTTLAISRLVETVTVPRKASKVAVREIQEERRRLGY